MDKVSEREGGTLTGTGGREKEDSSRRRRMGEREEGDKPKKNE